MIKNQFPRKWNKNDIHLFKQQLTNMQLFYSLTGTLVIRPSLLGETAVLIPLFIIFNFQHVVFNMPSEIA
jgi:hypothetical protein